MIRWRGDRDDHLRTYFEEAHDPIPGATLERLVNAARLAPSGANLQPLEFIIVDDRSLVDQIFPCLKWAAYIAPRGDPPEGKRPVAYIVVLVNTRIKSSGYEHDSGAAIENLILTALEEGIGSCWLGSIDRKTVKRILRIPDHYLIDSIVALGYPDEGPIMEEAEGDIKYWLDEEGRLHVPKRGLSKIMHHNYF